MKKDQATGKNTNSAAASSGKLKPEEIAAVENDNFISEKDEVKHAEDKLRDQIKKTK